MIKTTINKKAITNGCSNAFIGCKKAAAAPTGGALHYLTNIFI